MNKNTVETLKDLYPGGLVRLRNRANLMNDVVKEMLSELERESSELQAKQDYDGIIKLVKAQRDLKEVVINNDSLIKRLPTNTIEVKAPIVSHHNYEVNTNEPYNLQECFRFKRPHAFRIGSDYISAATWKEMLIKTCEYLNLINPELFATFVNDKSLHWGNTFNFSTNRDLIREPKLIGDSSVYVESAKGAIGARQLIIKMLSKYKMDLGSYKVYLRADYSPKREYDVNYRRRMKRTKSKEISVCIH